MATDIFEIGSISSRGQIAIPSSIRRELGLEEGTKLLFILQDETILIHKVTSETFAKITEPLRKSKKKINEDEVVNLIHKIRKAKRDKSNT